MTICKHVYESVGAATCPHCGGATHEVDWQLAHEQHRAWKEYIVNNPQEMVWWSI